MASFTLNATSPPFGFATRRVHPSSRRSKRQYRAVSGTRAAAADGDDAPPAAAQVKAGEASTADVDTSAVENAIRTVSVPSNMKGVPPIIIFGAGGKTGKRCVQYAAKAGRPVVACTRNGSFSSADLGLATEEADFVTAKAGDVSRATQAELVALMAGAGAVIFAASASPNGGTPQEVDKAGLVAVARACIAAAVPRLIIVSSGSVTKPLSPVYVFLNFFGGIMRAKIEGEDAVRQLYFQRTGCDYVVVRPGGLTEDEPRGLGAVELNQGDDKSGRISRADVAAICVEAAIAAAAPGAPTSTTAAAAANATFECYWADTAKSLNDVGLSNMMGSKSDDTEYVSGKEQRGATGPELLAGLEADAPGVSQQGCGFSL
mmetsp:Transcript_12757/g.31004  ORF Transcript_12757/g.31004 Transcript_12757/m.31004 type:complete len:375 (-) Transcript_12757:1150-2274(-)